MLTFDMLQYRYPDNRTENFEIEISDFTRYNPMLNVTFSDISTDPEGFIVEDDEEQGFINIPLLADGSMYVSVSVYKGELESPTMVCNTDNDICFNCKMDKGEFNQLRALLFAVC